MFRDQYLRKLLAPPQEEDRLIYQGHHAENSPCQKRMATSAHQIW